MKISLNRLSWGIILILGLTSCENLTQRSDSENLTDIDSLSQEVESPKTRSLSGLQPELVGIWRLTEAKLGNTLPMSEDIVGKLTLEFTAEGTVISTNPELGPATFPVVEQDGQTLIDDGIGGQTISEISANRLVITYEIDQELVTQIYERVE